MKIEEFVNAFAGAFDDVDVREVSADTVFKELPAWDSLAVLTVTDAIEADFSVLLTRVDYANAQTVRDLYEIVESKLTSGS
ncbi:acyl carrier protein [Coraliomargarita algicola]|uniref:Acyl carrier protein n=1 Tax=Coraliomargarita algicola TaxID=3092156 RepID=A0ABZ0RRI8_9BACT|nr:acyl carrier protein [Coraliomargarita sp. J2-16]WPJ97968.1 acyl carrier protein [Coraliomargarita sp. J2-16]